jgi:hypothetical protein
VGVQSAGVLDMYVHDTGLGSVRMDTMGMHCMGMCGVDMPGMGLQYIKREIYSAVKNLKFDAH